MATPQQLIAKATRQLDLRKDFEAAETSLREAIASARELGRRIDEVQAMAFLGEVLAKTGRELQAFELFRQILTISADPNLEPDLIAQEIRIAREYLTRAHSPE